MTTQRATEYVTTEYVTTYKVFLGSKKIHQFDASHPFFWNEGMIFEIRKKKYQIKSIKHASAFLYVKNNSIRCQIRVFEKKNAIK